MEFLIALFIVIICSGNFLLGYLYAKRECRSEIEMVKKKYVKVKVIRPNTIPLSVTERVSIKEVARGGDNLLLELENRMHHNLIEGIKPYILKQSCQDPLTESYVFTETLLVVKPMEGEEP